MGLLIYWAVNVRHDLFFSKTLLAALAYVIIMSVTCRMPQRLQPPAGTSQRPHPLPHPFHSTPSPSHSPGWGQNQTCPNGFVRILTGLGGCPVTPANGHYVTRYGNRIGIVIEAVAPSQLVWFWAGPPFLLAGYKWQYYMSVANLVHVWLRFSHIFCSGHKRVHQNTQ